MAIFSLNHRAIGKSTQKARFTAAAHVLYITRVRALSWKASARMPGEGRAAARWFRKEERGDRKNARVADRLIIALPRELTLEQQGELVSQFAEQLTQGKAPWIAAIHARGKDADNPHCHLVVRDRDPETGRRVAMFSAGLKERNQALSKGRVAPTSTLGVREMWEMHVNRALAAAGRSERVDRRSLKARGIQRKPQVHEGPRARELAARGALPMSRVRTVRAPAIRKPGISPERAVDYNLIDKGQSRVAYNSARRAEVAAERPRAPIGQVPQQVEGLRPRVQAPARPAASSSGRAKPRIPLR